MPRKKLGWFPGQTWIFIVLLLTCLGLFLWPLISEGLDDWQARQTVEKTATVAPPRIPEAPLVNRDRLYQSVDALSTQRFTDEQREIARDYIESQLAEAGWAYTEDVYDTGVNIVARQANISNDSGEILVGAHYDTQPQTPGADDNATGVSAILEIARIMGRQNFPKNLTLVFFDQEEQRGLGSIAYTSSPDHLAQLDGAIILEMLGYTCSTKGCQEVPENFPVEPPSEVGDFLAVVGDLEHPELTNAFKAQLSQSSLPLLVFSVPFKGILTPVVLSSDHVPFWLQGAGAVMVTDTAYLRNPHYHKTSDELTSLDWNFFTDSSQIVVNSVWELLHRS